MQAAALMAIYIVTAAVVQFVGFLISRLIDYQWPTAGLLTFPMQLRGPLPFGLQNGRL